MKIYGLVGKSGTGKSFQAPNVCRDRGIEAIIDDGLFICDNAVMAGHSAKRDENKMTAIKTAIFNDEKDQAEVTAKIRERNPGSILILGTSTGMISRICQRLELPEPSEIIHIEDIADSDAINTALRQRRELGKHVIPVPTVAIKQQFSGYFMMPLRILRGMSDRSAAGNEKSVVRPTYSYLGKFTINDRAVEQIVEHVCDTSPNVAEFLKCTIISTKRGVTINVNVIFEYVANIRRCAFLLQEAIDSEVENMTAFNILDVNVSVRGLRPKLGQRRRTSGVDRSAQR